MSNTTKPARKRRFSKFLAHRNTAALGTFSFVRQHQGSVAFTKMETGAYRAVFSSKATGRKAFAYGRTFQGAYKNMIRLFNIKYAA